MSHPHYEHPFSNVFPRQLGHTDPFVKPTPYPLLFSTGYGHLLDIIGDFNRLAEELGTSQQELSRQTSVVEASEREMTALRSVIDEQVVELADLKGKIRILTSNIPPQERECLQLEMELQEMTDELTASNVRIRELEACDRGQCIAEQRLRELDEVIVRQTQELQQQSGYIQELEAWIDSLLFEGVTFSR